ncbi:MAG: CHAT domain-containing protein [Planctomycetes bacterium]|nr:CHAT domain-containing protein [Planctomycetota bacterium]
MLAAVVAKDDAALKALASKDDPDPWLVADELIRRGKLDEAEAFAKVAPRVDTEALLPYVASRRGKSDDSARRERIAKATAALNDRRGLEAISELRVQNQAPIEDVVGVSAAMVRASAFAATGRLAEAAANALLAAEAAERIRWLVCASRCFHESGVWAFRSGALLLARSAWERRRSLCERRGDRTGEAQSLGNIGVVYRELGEHSKALEFHERTLATMESLGDLPGVSAALTNLGHSHDSLGDRAGALAYYRRAWATQDGIGDRAGAARSLMHIGVVHQALGAYSDALESTERALAMMEGLGDREGVAAALNNLGVIHSDLGEYRRALTLHQRALAAKQALGDHKGAASTLANIGTDHYELGDYAKALSYFERARAASQALGDRRAAANALGNIGVVHDALGDVGKSLSAHERALAAKEALGDRAGVAATLGNIGYLHSKVGDYANALSCHERALAMKEALGDKGGAAATLAAVGGVYYSLGDYAKALSVLERAHSASEALGDRKSAAITLVNIGLTHKELGDYAKALSTLDRALTSAEAMGAEANVARILGNVGLVHAARGDFAQADAFARRAVGMHAHTIRGLSAEEGAGAREPIAFAYDVGGVAAVALDDAPELAFFLESVRAAALVEGLGARAALWASAVPELLRGEDAKTRAAETRAVAALRKALDGGDLAATKARRAELEAAQEAVAAVVSRIQREAKAGAALVYPEAATLDEIRATLDAGDALVLYALFEKDAVALVVERGSARIVRMGPRAPIDAAAEAAAEALADDASDPTAPLRALTDLVVKPLGLGEGTKRVLVSPTGLLSYVPFAALIRDRTVAYVPSGTTYRLLREEEALRGEGVLALGDPDYETKIDERALAVNRGAAGKLVRLPATRDEALAVGTTTLLGADATEAGLRKALAERKRWRAVHLACHGLVNTERPALSSLAITAAGDDDGFLTCLDVFRMKVPSDLVVLSACETGKGKVVKGEGIVGLTRAFMFAGSPRVLCSLWKVDDAATAALMTKFYELWNPKTGSKGMGTAEALRAAQEHVRSQEKWKHPYYWAAWVLWGLPS